MSSTPAKVAHSASRLTTTRRPDGKTAGRTDTFHGHFAKLVPNEKVVEVLEFKTADPDLRGEMTMTTTLADADDGTDVVVKHDGTPPGVSVVDNAALLESSWPGVTPVA